MTLKCISSKKCYIVIESYVQYIRITYRYIYTRPREGRPRKFIGGVDRPTFYDRRTVDVGNHILWTLKTIGHFENTSSV